LKGREFDSRLGRYQVVTTTIGVCLSRYIINTKVNSAFNPSGVGKSSTGLSGWGNGTDNDYNYVLIMLHNQEKKTVLKWHT